MGIRSEESSRRANRPNPSYIKAHKYWMDKPIFDWQEWEVWDYIERNELSYCSLYDEGFSRIGCVICPFLCGKNTKRVMKHKERWPKHYAMFEKVMHRLFKQHKERLREKSAEELIQNWYRGN
jgi:phosphoadenosine phosphosulfate reductase